MAKKMTLEQVHEKVELAGVYAFDGAFFTAASRLQEAADMMKQLAEEDRTALDQFVGEKR